MRRRPCRRRGVAPAALVAVATAKSSDRLCHGVKVVLSLAHTIDPPPHVLGGVFGGKLSLREEQRGVDARPDARSPQALEIQQLAEYIVELGLAI